MVLLDFLSGQKAGTSQGARRFPLRIGRSEKCEIRSADPGVWDEHLTLNCVPSEGFVLETFPNTRVSLNGESVQRSLLRNGDVIEIGALKLQFWLAEAPQKSLRFREGFVWTVIVMVSVCQVALIYWLIQ